MLDRKSTSRIYSQVGKVNVINLGHFVKLGLHQISVVSWVLATYPRSYRLLNPTATAGDIFSLMTLSHNLNLHSPDILWKWQSISYRPFSPNLFDPTVKITGCKVFYLKSDDLTRLTKLDFRVRPFRVG